jgi:hypothetical protein
LTVRERGRATTLVIAALALGSSTCATAPPAGPVIPSNAYLAAMQVTLQTSIPHWAVPTPPKVGPLRSTPVGPKGGAPHVGWKYEGTLPPGYDAIRATISPQSYAAGAENKIYWAFDSVFQDGQTYYTGLQPNGQYGKTALFSVFGPEAYPRTPYCKSGADNGPGTSCHIPYDWQLGREYELTVALVDGDAQWMTWEGAVFDLTTGERTLIGDITVAASRGLLKGWWGTSFAEYYKHIDACTQQPASEVLFFAPFGYRSGHEFAGEVSSLETGDKCSATFYGDGHSYVYLDEGY